MEALCPASYFLNSNLLLPQIKSTKWTREENKTFERALAIVDEKTPDRWFRVAAMIPGKSVSDVINQYQELVADVNSIEAGQVPIPGYLASSLTFELMDNPGFDTFRKRGRSIDQERKKGIPWTEDEHRRFLMGLQVHGKGDWRNISRKFVISKTPAQVASHAQKYFLRQHSGGKDKKRPSIHDITTVHLPNPNPTQESKCASLEKSLALSPVQKSTNASKILLDWNNSNEGLLMVFDSMDCDESVGSLFDVATRGRYAANHFFWQMK